MYGGSLDIGYKGMLEIWQEGLSLPGIPPIKAELTGVLGQWLCTVSLTWRNEILAGSGLYVQHVLDIAEKRNRDTSDCELEMRELWRLSMIKLEHRVLRGGSVHMFCNKDMY
jgi:hypothetical protein